MTKFEAGEGEQWREFYNLHRGGGNVIMVMIANPGEVYPTRFAIFSCIETAEEWAYQVASDDHNVCFAPFVIDEPDFGNATKQ